MDITNMSLIIIILIVVGLVIIRYGFEKLLSRAFKSAVVKYIGLTLLLRANFLIAFNIALLIIFRLLKIELFSFSQIKNGLTLLAIGVGLSLIVAALSIMAIKAGYGKGYETFASTSSLNKWLTLVTFLLFVGLSEDLFFIGLIQNILTPYLGWWAILIYLFIFIVYHYANVLSGVEDKKEFLGTLPIRLIVSSLLALSFYLTRSLVYGLIIHNTIDTLSYLALMIAVKKKD